MVNLLEADTYFDEQVLHNAPWLASDTETKERALRNAENMLYRFFPRYNKEEKPLPVESIYEQAHFIMLIDETIQKSVLGVKQVSVSGVSISVQAPNYPISPEAKMIIIGGGGTRTGRSLL